MTYLGARGGDEDGARYLHQVGAMWMISATARIMDPGIKVDPRRALRPNCGENLAHRVSQGCAGPCWVQQDISHNRIDKK